MNLFANLCPRCDKGRIFKSFLSMNKACPSCGYVFEREQGYFMGALFINYSALALSTLPLLFVFIYFNQPIIGGVVCYAQFMLLSPFALRFSRILWIRMDYQRDPR